MKETRFEKLHPAVSFAFLITAICLVVLLQHPAYLAAGIFSALCLNISLSGKKAPRKFLLLLPLWALISAINPILNTLGETVLFRYFGRPYTWEALCYGMATAGVFVAMIEWFSAYNLIMTEDKFSYLFGTLAPSLALLLTTVLRLVPTLLRKTRQISDTRKCIGKGVAEGMGRRGKIAEGMTVLSVLTTTALEGGVITADSMNSRGYGTGRRSSYHSYKFRTADVRFAAMCALLLCAAIVPVFAGSAQASYTPVMEIAPVNAVSLSAYAFFMLIPTILNMKEEMQWHISRSKI